MFCYDWYGIKYIEICNFKKFRTKHLYLYDKQWKLKVVKQKQLCSPYVYTVNKSLRNKFLSHGKFLADLLDMKSYPKIKPMLNIDFHRTRSRVPVKCAWYNMIMKELFHYLLEDLILVTKKKKRIAKWK